MTCQRAMWETTRAFIRWPRLPARPVYSARCGAALEIRLLTASGQSLVSIIQANQVYAGDNGKGHFDQGVPPATDKLNGKPLASGQKADLGAAEDSMGGDQITCGVQDAVIACVVVKGFNQNHGDGSAERHGFVIDPQKAGRFEQGSPTWTVAELQFTAFAGSTSRLANRFTPQPEGPSR